MAQPPSRTSHHHHHHHHHTQHITDPSRRKKKHLATAHLTQLQLDHQLDDVNSNNGISSSRDASEEDNDDQEETFDDDASVTSLKHHQQQNSSSSIVVIPTSSSLASLPPTHHDQAVINSALQPHPLSQSHKPKPVSNVLNDRTPSSSSPPKLVATLSNSAIPPHQAKALQLQSQHARAPSSDDDYARPNVSAMSADASAALSSSSSVELFPRSVPNKPSAAQDVAAAAASAKPSKSSNPGLNLGTLPASAVSQALLASKPSGDQGLGFQGSTAVTLKALQLSQDDADLNSSTVALDTTSSATLSELAQTISKKSMPLHHHHHHQQQLHHHHPPAVATLLKRNDQDGDPDADGTNTDGGTPYDGDVEFAARAPVSAQSSSGTTLVGTSKEPGHPVQPSTAALAASSPQPLSTPIPNTAFCQVPSYSYMQTFRLPHPDSHPEGDRYKEEGFHPRSIATAQEIQRWVHDAIVNPDPKRNYSINPPACRIDKDGKVKPIRIYADGVYDLFHYAHALQLRQAKLSFPSVHLIVGVVSSHSCTKHKNKPIMSSQERYESVRNCRWVDEVLEDAPWLIDQNLIDTLEIDYVAHDELPYGGKGQVDIYDFVKKQGRFLPTRRTEGVSTSELLGRVVQDYREGSIDGKLCKIGLERLTLNVGSDLLEK